MMNRRAVLLTLLAASVLFAGSAQAQRGGGAMRGGSARTVSGVGHHGARVGNNRNRNGGFIYPLWDDEPYWYDAPYGDENADVPAPQRMAVRARPAEREIPAASPKVIELPGASNSATFKPEPPATFILTSGERFEARRYLLTHDTLYLTVDHQERSFPLAMLDINATTAANHERGVEMRIPAGRSEFSLSF